MRSFKSPENPQLTDAGTVVCRAVVGASDPAEFPDARAKLDWCHGQPRPPNGGSVSGLPTKKATIRMLNL
jgi:hypothetical protein